MPPIPPMLAEISREVPRGDYLYEPGWDGFRALIFRDGAEIVLMSQNQRPLERWFPELVRALRSRLPRKVVLDGEIVVTGPHGLDFDALLLRIHPNDARVDKLARLHPASFVAFDLLALGAQDLREQPMVRRRTALEKALKKATPPLYVTPATTDPAVARGWLDRFEGGGLEGVLCKPLSSPYVAGRRSMIKVRHERTADCVIGGFRRGKEGKAIASLLLGLYDHAGDLQHVGVATGFDAETRAMLEEKLEPLRIAEGGSHPWLGPHVRPDLRVPGGAQSWADDRHAAWEAVEPSLIARVEYDHMQGERFRHATHFQRLVTDRDPRSCNFEQVARRPSAELVTLLRAS
jgi:ATP-dependent DNA ligase